MLTYHAINHDKYVILYIFLKLKYLIGVEFKNIMLLFDPMMHFLCDCEFIYHRTGHNKNCIIFLFILSALPMLNLGM